MKDKKPPSINDIKNFENLYDIHRSLRVVARISGWCPTTVKKYVTYRHKRIRKENSKSVVDWRNRTKRKLVDLLGGECKHCGYKKSIKALQFHHTNPKKKDFTISGKSWSFKRLKKEALKCILLCANCHIEEHEKMGW